MSDNDLIRRGDALKACELRGYDHAHHMQAKADCAAAIAALPAVQIRPDYFAMAMQDDDIAAIAAMKGADHD